MRTVLGLFAFLFVWVCSCAFVEYVVPDIANSYQMMIGAIAALIGNEVTRPKPTDGE